MDENKPVGGKNNPRMRLAYMGLGKIKSEMNDINKQADQFFKSDLFKK